MTKSLAALLLAAAMPLSAATRIWSGAIDGHWANGGNWSGLVAPVAGDDLQFPAGVPNRVNTNDYPDGTTFSHLSFADSYQVSGNSIMLLNGVSTSAGETTLNMPIRLAASQSWDLLKPLNITGAVDLNGATLTLSPSESTLTLLGPLSGTGNVFVDFDFLLVHRNATSSMTGVITARGSTALFYGASIPGAEIHLLGGAVIVAGNASVGKVFDLEGGSIFRSDSFFGPDFTSGSFAARTQSLSLTFRPSQFWAVLKGTALGRATQVSVNGAVRLGSKLLIDSGPYFAEGTTFRIIDNDDTDAVVGTFNGVAEGSTVRSLGGYQLFRVSYAGGTGNDVTLTAMGKPSATVLSVSPYPAKPLQFVTLTAKVSGDFGTPTGHVTFWQGRGRGFEPIDGASVDAAGVATTAMQFPGGAPLTLFAVYEGDATYAGSESNHIPQVLPFNPKRRVVQP